MHLHLARVAILASPKPVATRRGSIETINELPRGLDMNERRPVSPLQAIEHPKHREAGMLGKRQYKEPRAFRIVTNETRGGKFGDPAETSFGNFGPS